MTTSEPTPPIEVGIFFGMPMIQLNENFSAKSGREMSDRIVAALQEHCPSTVHPQYTSGYDQ